MQTVLKRPVVLFCISLIAGILTAAAAKLPIIVIAALILAVSCIFIFKIWLKSGLFIPIGILLFFMAGALEYTWLDKTITSSFSEFDGENVEVTGFIASEPDIKDTKISYIVDVTAVKAPNTTYMGGGKVLMSTSKVTGAEQYSYGTGISFTGTLYKPFGVRNPGGFDYRRYLAGEGISATIFALRENIKFDGSKKPSIIYEAGAKIRRSITTVIEKSLPRQQAGLLDGMLIGYREGLSEEVRQAFSDAGLSHIMAVSGANVAFLVLPLAFLFKKLRLKRQVSHLLTIAFLLFFLFITGFEPSVLRAVIMAVIVLAGKIVYREADIYTSIALAAIAILLYNPFMLYNAGFTLTFAATISLILFSKNIKVLIKRLPVPGMAADIISVTLAAQIGVLPVILAYFNRVSLISVVSNLLVVPVLEIVTILGMLMVVFGQLWLVLAQLLGFVNRILLSFILLVTEVSAKLPFATVKTPTPPLIVIILYYLTVWYLLCFLQGKEKPKGLRRAVIPAVLAVTVLIWQIVPGGSEVVFLDVGEGDASFIRTASGKTLLVDGGGSTNPNLDSAVGDAVLIPFLLDSGVSSLDMVIATHGHSDHIQGLQAVIEQMRVKNLVIPDIGDMIGYEKLLEAASKRGVRVSRCSRGDVIRLGGDMSMNVLYPFKMSEVHYSTLNDTSLVLKLHYGKSDILFTGDIQSEVEQELLEYEDPESQGASAGRGTASAGSGTASAGSGTASAQHSPQSDLSLKADILKVAHHGSDTSTGRDFLKAVGPKAAIISVGRNNFGHPSDTILSLLGEEGVRVFRTDECGALALTSGGGGLAISKTVTGSR